MQGTFIKRFNDFLTADSFIGKIANIDDDGFHYESESFIPTHIDPSKKNLVIILGNPAPESVAMGAMFAYEGSGKRYHRFWRVLDDTGVLRFSDKPDMLDPHEKMRRLYAGEYTSPFNIFILPFYSFPTPPGGVWNGVAGVRRLFAESFTIVEKYDTKRILDFLDSYLHEDDYVLAFQKDAFVALTERQEPPVAYNYKELLGQPSFSLLPIKERMINVNLICMLPTRLLHSRCTKDLLASLGSDL